MYTGTVIDCDVHHNWSTPDDLLPYFTEGWREYVQLPARAGGTLVPYYPTQIWPNITGPGYRPETYAPNGGAPGSEYELLRDQLLEPNRIERAVLLYESGTYVGALTNPYFATALARAANDWSIDNWLDKGDDRLCGAVLVASQLPDEAAKEIRRVGGHPRMVEVLLVSSGLGKPFGHPVYHPIYEAASDMNLPIAIHSFGDVYPGHNIAPTGGGMPSFYFEIMVLNFQAIMTHLTSFLAHGIFERFPRLRLLLIEAGVSWIPGLLWKMDDQYRVVRAELPWLKRYPSEYFHDHVRVTTHPLECPDHSSEDFVKLLGMYGAEDILCFSSDYPHWDTDEKDYIAGRLPTEWQAKVFRENAMELYGWSDHATP